MKRGAAALAVALLTVLGAGPVGAAPPKQLFRITDPRIDEASGIAIGRVSPNVFYVQNDSGDRSRFFALDRVTGATTAVIEVPGVRNDDWEDIAVAPDRSGRSSVWLADTGDNRADRDEIQVIRVDEPVIGAGDDDVTIVSSAPEVWHLRYPDGPVDAESLAVGPDGTAYLVTKSVLGVSVVFRVPGEARAKVQTLERVATTTFVPTGAPGGPAALVGQVTATGASLSPDGSVLAIRTYTDAYLWRVADGDLAAALRVSPRRIALPRQPQGEGIALAPGALVVDSEGTGEPVYVVPRPGLGPSPRGSPDVTGTSPATSPARTTPSAATAVAGVPDRHERPGSERTLLLIAMGAGAAVLTAVIWLLVAPRRRHVR